MVATTTSSISPLSNMPVWTNDSELDLTWIQEKLQDPFIIKATVIDISNDTRKGETPKDGATLKVSLTRRATNDEDAENITTSTLVLKQDTGGNPMTISLGLAREALFYRHLAHKVKDVDIPEIYYSHGDFATGEKVVLMEDLSKKSKDGSSFLDSGILFGPGKPNNWSRDLEDRIAKAYDTHDLSPAPSSEEVAGATFRAIAKVHATFWNDASLLENEWLRGANWVQGKDEASWRASQGYIQAIYQSGIDDKIEWDPLVKATVDHAMAGISWEAQVQRLNTIGNTHWTLVHGDFWPGNVLISTKDCEDLRMLDWEMTGIGSGPQDLGQYILSNMYVEERRDCEERLVKDYYETLKSNGIKDDELSWEDCWSEYLVGGVERWLWFLVNFCGQQGPLLKWGQFFHDQILLLFCMITP